MLNSHRNSISFIVLGKVLIGGFTLSCFVPNHWHLIPHGGFCFKNQPSPWPRPLLLPPQAALWPRKLGRAARGLWTEGQRTGKSCYSVLGRRDTARGEAGTSIRGSAGRQVAYIPCGISSKTSYWRRDKAMKHAPCALS